MNDVLVDASFLVALGYPSDRHHSRSVTFAGQDQKSVRLLVPDVVLAEVVYNLRRLLGNIVATRFTQVLATKNMPLVPLTTPDFLRAASLMSEYQDAELDFVDCCLTALAERLTITRICTFDRRDFSMIRPAHIEYFTLLP